MVSTHQMRKSEIIVEYLTLSLFIEFNTSIFETCTVFVGVRSQMVNLDRPGPTGSDPVL